MIKLELAYNDIVDDDFYITDVKKMSDDFEISLYGDKNEIAKARSKFGDLYTYTLIDNMPVREFSQIKSSIEFVNQFKPIKVVSYSYLLGTSLIHETECPTYLSVLSNIRSIDTVYEMKANGFTGFVLAHDKVFDTKFQKECKDMGMKLIGLTTMGCPPCMAFSEKHHTIYMVGNMEMANSYYECPTMAKFNPLKLNIVPPSFLLKEEMSSIDEFKFSGRFVKYPEFAQVYKELLSSFLLFDDEKYTYLMLKHFVYHDKVTDEIVDKINRFTRFFLDNKKFCGYECWKCGNGCDEKFKDLGVTR